MVETINQWIKKHAEAEITIVDIEDNLTKHNLLTK